RAIAAKEPVFVPYAPVAFISAKYAQRVHQVLDLALEVVKERKKRSPTSALNKMLREAVANHPPSSKSGKPIKFFYGTQVDIEPPTFVFFCSDPEAIHFSYRRYIENQLREQFAFIGTPIRISFRGRDE